jgi:hypothetical protein
MEDNNSPIQNPGEKHYKDEFDYLKKAETNSTNNDNISPDDGSDKINDLENKGGWINNTTNSNTKEKNKVKGKANFLKSKGPSALIITFILSSLSFVGFIGNPAFLNQSIFGNLISKFNIQETSLEARASKLTYNKISKAVTSGVCGTKINILCKYSRPSNKLLRNLKKNGIEALDKNDKVIEGTGILPNTRPVKYKYTNSSGEEIEIKAEDFSKRLSDNPEFRAAFHDAYNPRFISVIDSVFSKIKAKIGFSTSDKLKESTDEESATKEINDESSAIEEGTSKVEQEGKEATEQEVKEIIEKESDEEAEKIGETGKKGGGAVSLIPAVACMAKDIPGLITKASRAFQMAQLIKYSAVFLSTFGSIKAGDATPAETSAVGDILTKVVNGKSAMDSFGMKYAITGDTVPTTTNYKKYAPGGNVISALGSFVQVAGSNGVSTACNVATSTAANGVIDVALGTTIIGEVVNIGVGYAVGQIVEAITPKIVSALMSVIPTDKILGFFLGDLTQNLSGENVGDALTSGASHVMGQTSNAGGNVPLTVSQAVAYNQETQKVQLAYAEEDRVTKSPLDVSSQNTFMGSIVNQLMPYYLNSGSSFGSISNIFATVANLASNSLGFIYKSSSLYTSADSNNTSQYQLCDDPSIKDNDVAAGPYCNIIYGVPTEYLNVDSTDVLNYMIDNKYIDEDTGDVITDSNKGSTDYNDWITKCTDGTTQDAASCKVTDQKNAYFSLYTIDHRVEQTMDDDSDA